MNTAVETETSDENFVYTDKPQKTNGDPSRAVSLFWPLTSLVPFSTRPMALNTFCVYEIMMTIKSATATNQSNVVLRWLQQLRGKQ